MTTKLTLEDGTRPVSIVPENEDEEIPMRYSDYNPACVCPPHWDIDPVHGIMTPLPPDSILRNGDDLYQVEEGYRIYYCHTCIDATTSKHDVGKSEAIVQWVFENPEIFADHMVPYEKHDIEDITEPPTDDDEREESIESALRRERCRGYDARIGIKNQAETDGVGVLVIMEYRKYANVQYDLDPLRCDLADDAQTAVQELLEDYLFRARDDEEHKHWPVTFSAGRDFGEFDRLRIPVAEELADDLEKIVGDSENWIQRNR